MIVRRPFRIAEVRAVRLLLIECEIYIDGARHRATYHRVVADAEEAHHLYVSRHGGRASELCVRVHTAEGIGHTFGNLTFSIYEVRRNVMVISYID